MLHPDRPWDKSNQSLLLFIVTFNVIPHTLEVPPWTTALAFLFLIWKALYLTRGLSLPPRWLLWSLSVGGALGVFVEYGTILGQEAATALLVFLASSKLLETNRYRDAMLVVFTSYFLLMAHLLASQSLASTVYMAVDVLLITTLMFQIHKKDRRSSVRSFRPIMKMLGYALPVWVFLFVFFPRFSAGLWKMQSNSGSQSGFSDSLSPGEIERLVQDDGTAFRVNILAGRSVPPSRMYWRGGILTVSDGLRWSRPEEASNTEPTSHPDQVLPALRLSRILEYEVWMEPTFKKWLFLLDYPRELTPGDRLQRNGIKAKPGFIHEVARDAAQVFTFTATATAESPDSPVQKMTSADLAPYLQLPKGLDPRIFELVKTIESRPRPDDADLMKLARAERLGQRMLDWFALSGFRYTKDPGMLRARGGPQQLAEFLFETRRGFCEHYAAAFATLMRAAGIPARVTIGFQGGQLNEFGRYLLVRNLDAHAWTEVWRQDPSRPDAGQWVRIDPTEAVAPLRLQLGGDYNLLDQTLLASGMSQDEIQRSLKRGFKQINSRILLAMDALQMQWNSFLIKYDFEYQRSLLSRIGLKEASRVVFFIWAFIGVIFLMAGLHFLMRRRAVVEDPVIIAWRLFCSRLEAVGIARAPNEGPLAFGQRAAATRPDRAQAILEITQSFIDLRYGPEASAQTSSKLRAFRHSVRRFSIAESSANNPS